MKLCPRTLLACIALGTSLVACAAGAQKAPATAMNPNAAPAVLQTSLYAKDASGGLDEASLQTILSTPIDLELPARVGVVPLDAPFDAKGPVALSTRVVASRDLASGLVGAPYFSQVSDISTDLPNVGGVEGLRVIAARYRVRYLLLYSQRFEDATHLNDWAFLYPTVIGMFVAPGVTVESNGIAQADMIDVRTGTVLFSVVEPMHVSSKEQMIGAARAHEEAQLVEARAAARRIAKKVVMQTNALVAFADASAKEQHPIVRIVPAPIETTVNAQ